MYQQFQRLKDREDREELRAFIQRSSVEELVNVIHNSIYKLDAPKVLDDILLEFSDSEACQLKRRVLVEAVLKDLGKVQISVGQVDAIVNRIIVDFPKYFKQHLVKLVDFCLNSIRNNDDALHSWKDLLPVLLEILENEKYIVHMDSELSGDEYKLLIIQAICNCRWNVNLLPSLAKMFGDIALDKAVRNQVLRALCSTLIDLPLDQIPPFVYQILKFSKDRDCLYLLDALNKYFQSQYSKAISNDDKDSLEDIGVIGIKEVQDIESTVLYYIYQAAQLNHENMKDFIRHLKNLSSAPEYILQPFMLAVFMSISSIYEDQIFEIMRSTIVNNSLEKGKREFSAWSRQLIPSPCNIVEIIRKIIDCSNKDRHLLLKGFMNLAFALLSSDQKFKNNATVMWSTGAEIIREIIKKRHETVATVMQELVNKIVAGGTSTIHYIDCLHYACRELSMMVLDHQIWIMILLERLIFLPSTVANQVLHAIFPLMRVSPNIRENLMLTLRKALYRKGVSKRQMAVTGFLEMLKYSRIHSLDNFRLSQRHHSSQYLSSSVSTSTSTSKSRLTLTQVTLEHASQRNKSDYEKTLCYEILDILKKSFTYEFEVRLHLYEGLYNTVIKNPEITEILLDMLLSHLNLYMDTADDDLPPVKFHLCTNVIGTEVILQEPIAELIFALQKIYVNCVPRKSSTFDKIREALETLCERMIATELKHLNLEHETDLFGDLSKSQIKIKNLAMTVTIYEALMAFRIGECSKGNLESFPKIDDLFKAYTRSVDFIKTQSTKVKKLDNSKAKKEKDVNNTMRKLAKSNSIKVPNTIMDLDVIRQSLTLLYSQSFATPDEITFQENPNFRSYIFQACEQLLERTKSVTNTPPTENNRYTNLYIEIGGLIFKHLILNLNDVLEDNEETAVSALQCFKEISCCTCTCTSSSAELTRFLNSILPSRKGTLSEDVNSKLEEIIFLLKPYLETSLVEETNNDERKKIPFLLLEIIERFIYKIDFEKYDSDKILDWFRKMAGMENVENSIVSAITRSLLRLEEHTKEYGETLHEICMELCEKVGTIDGAELIVNEKYKVIREDTALQIYNVLNGCIKEKLNNACWLLTRLKAEDTVARAPGIINETWNNRLREKERNLCKQLSRLAQILCTLANTSVDPGPCTDVTFKNLQYLYHLIGNLTKYFYIKSDNQNAAFQAVRFIQVVQLAGKPLKSVFYNLVTYVEENQNKSRSKSDSHAQRNKILKETKVIPRVVYEIEQFNKEILLLGKKTSIPLENYIKHSVTRDFRIKNPQLVEDLEKMDVSLLASPELENSRNTDNENHSSSADETNNDRNDADDANDASPAAKRFRTQDERIPSPL